jgi:hypothetical protein
MARHLIAAFEKFGEKSETVSDLQLRVVFLLSAPSTPQDVVDEVIADAKAGKPVTDTTVKNKIQAKSKAKQPKLAKPKPEDSAAVYAQVKAMQQAAIKEGKPIIGESTLEAQPVPWEKMTPRERCLDRVRPCIIMFLGEAYADRAGMFADLRDLIDRIEAEPEFDETEEDEEIAP